ncbi:hypothetical protein Tco_1233942, partial [Tanacetum coccineum]
VLEIYMHQFWHTITKIKNSSLYKFKLDKKQCIIDVEVFCDILQICPRLPIQAFDAPPSDEEITFALVINKCLSGKITGLDKIRLSRAQILWGMYYNKNVDFVELLWEDFVFQIDNRDHKKQEKIYYPRFTKVIIHHFISKDTSISMRNKIFMHTIRDDSVLDAGLSCLQDLSCIRYRSYKFKKPASPSKKKTLVAVEEPAEKPTKKPTTRRQSTGVQIRDTPGVSVSRKKAPAKTKRSKGIELLSDAALLEEAQLKKAIKQSRQETNIHHAESDDDNDDDDQQSDDERT